MVQLKVTLQRVPYLREEDRGQKRTVDIVSQPGKIADRSPGIENTWSLRTSRTAPHRKSFTSDHRGLQAVPLGAGRAA